MTNMKNRFKKLLTMVLIAVIAVTFMPPMAMEAFAADSSDLTLTLADESKTTYIEGEAIKVKATGTASGAWVGLYKKGDVYGSSTLSFRWFYVADYDGSVVDILKTTKQTPDRGRITEGDYEIVLFGDGEYSNVKKVIDIHVAPDPNSVPATPSEELSLKLMDETKTTYKIGEPIEVRATGPDDGSWVGLYRAGDAKDPENGGVTSQRWFYTGAYNGQTVDISSTEFDGNNWGGLQEGEYEIVLFGDGGYTNIVHTINITIEGIIDIDKSQFSLETDKTEYQYGEPIKVKATGTGIGEGAWVGLYYAGTTNYSGSYITYFYVRNHEGMFTAIANKAGGDKLAQGDYNIVLFADNGYSLPVLTTKITVIRHALASKVIRNATCTTLGLEYAEYEDGTKEYRDVQPLGHNWGEKKHVAGTATHQQKCKRSGCGEVLVEDCTYDAITVTKAATAKAAGEKTFHCSVCDTTTTEVIAKLKVAPTLATKTFVYNGKNRKPSVKKIYDANGNVIPKTFYTVSYPKTSKNIGAYKVTVKFKGDYAGTYNLTYKINPKATSLKKVTKGTKSIKVTWKKAASQTTGYQIAYSTNKNFKKTKYAKVKGIKETSTTIKKLKAKKKYYVKVRTYKTVKGKTYYSAWSKVKTVTTK